MSPGPGIHVGEGAHTYAWHDHSADLPADGAAGWSHHDVVVAGSGEVIAFHQADPVMLVFSPSGKLLRTIPVAVAEAHGMTLVREGDQERLWVTDPGSKAVISGEGKPVVEPSTWGPQVVKLDLDGRILQRLEKPSLPVYETGNYAPTSVAVDAADGGSGDIWVADGYGSSYVHRYDRDGRLLASISGEESRAGRLNCPHAVFIDRRRTDPELYVADRGNARIVVFGLDGEYRREVAGFFITPSALATYGEYLVVAELHARLTICDGSDRLVCYLGENAEVCAVPGWPNETDEDGKMIRSRLLEAGKFNSPHGLATGAGGEIYVSEWLIGGRLTKLEPTTT